MTTALDIIRDQIALPVAVRDSEEWWSTPDHFDPWEAFPSLYGSYSSAFDDMAILVLKNILNGTFGEQAGEGLAHEMFREMLCTANLCDYGTSPRGCFPTLEFMRVLPTLLEKWREYRRAEWDEDDEEGAPETAGNHVPDPRVFAQRYTPLSPLKFVLAPGENVKMGDLITLDRATGKVRKFVVGTDNEPAFTVPPGSRVTDDGCLEMPHVAPWRLK